MGAIKTVPIVGEAVTAVDSAAKTTLAGVCLITGETDLAKNLIESAGKSWKDYSDRSLLVAPLKVVYYMVTRQRQRSLEQVKKFTDSLEELADIIPFAGHVKGICHLANGDTEHGCNCLTKSSRVSIIAISLFLDYGTSLVSRGEPIVRIELADELLKRVA